MCCHATQPSYQWFDLKQIILLILIILSSSYWRFEFSTVNITLIVNSLFANCNYSKNYTGSCIVTVWILDPIPISIEPQIPLGLLRDIRRTISLSVTTISIFSLRQEQISGIGHCWLTVNSIIVGVKSLRVVSVVQTKFKRPRRS